MYNLLEFIKEKRALFLLSLIAAALFTVYMTQNHLKALGKQTENQSSCKQAQDLEIGKEPDPERVNSITSLLENTTKDLKNAHNDYRASSNGERKDKGEKLKEMASTRKALFVDAMRINPNDTLAFLLTEEEKKDISDLDGSCIEKETTVEGILEVLHADFIDKTSVTYYTITTDGGERINIHPAKGLKEALISGKRIKVKGYRIDNDLLYDGTSPDGLSIISQNSFFLIKPAFAAVPAAQGPQQTVVLLVNFQNTTQPTITKAVSDDLVFNQTNNYYLENSYGKTSMTGTTFGWYALPINQTCDVYQTQSEAIIAANADVNFAQYGRLIIVAPFGPGCSWAGMATIGQPPVQTGDGTITMSTSWIVSSYFDLHTVGHEFGHNLGENHASFLNCGSSSIVFPLTGCTNDEYGDFYDIMGSGNWLNGHFNGHHKDYIGWLDEGVDLLTVSSSGNYTIIPIATSSAGLKTLKIQRDPIDYLYIEYRQPIGFDSNLTGDAFSGALLHTLQYPSKTWLLDTSPPADRYTPSLKPGSTFTDPATGTQVAVTQTTNASLTANVTLGKSDFTAPTVTVTEPTPNATASGTINVSANATDSSGIQKVEFYVSSSSTPFATDVSSPYSASLDTINVPNGSRYVYAKAYDKSGEAWNVPGNFGNSTFVFITIANQDPTPPTVSIISPINNSYLKNPVQIKTDASDNVGIYKVEFWKDSDPYAYSTIYKTPFETYAFTFPNGLHTVTAKAFDFVGNITTAAVLFTADDLSPTVSITSPISGTTVQRNKNVTITAIASDNTAVTKVEFAVNGTIRCTDTTSPYSCVWKVPNTSGVTYTLSVKAYDAAGNFFTATITVKSK